MTSTLFKLLLCCIVLNQNLAPANAITPEVQQLIESWAPLIWLHSEEQFWPSSVEFFLPAMTVNDIEQNVIQFDPTPSTILAGNETTYNLHLQTKIALDCPECTNVAEFVGEPLVNGKVPPVYALYHEYLDADSTLDVYYHTFYPYNRGKDACVGIPTPDGDCIGPVESLGNHVGDWEHCTIRFRNGEPEYIYVSVHSFGAFYYWNPTDRRFEYYVGEPVRSVVEEACVTNDTDPGFGYVPKYPPTVELMDNHPILFSANGSHGLWSSSGVHIYFPGLNLTDSTDDGTPWYTWQNLTFVPWQAVDDLYEGDLSWMDFYGDWGNSADGCQYELITGECILGSGPSGPRAKFECFPVLEGTRSTDD